MDSILNSVKETIGINSDYTVFDNNLIMHINTVLFTLYQLGATESPVSISDSTAEWSSITPTTDLELIKTYVYLKTRMYFDPPTNSSLISEINDKIKELEWRINVEVDPNE